MTLALINKKIDISGNGLLFDYGKYSRNATITVYHQSWRFQSTFMFLETKSLHLASSTTNAFLMPFSIYSWGLILILLILIIFIHFILLNIIFRKANLTESIFETFGLFCQQGQTVAVKYFARKLWILILSFSFLIIYNLYTSTLLSGILKSSSKIPSTIEELLESPLQLHYQDVPIIRNNIFNNNHTITMKLISKNQKGNIPLLINIELATKLIKIGKIAFFIEKMIAYEILGKELIAEEICQLREAGEIFTTQLQLVLHSESQYLEMFRYGVLKSREYGLINRELLIHRIPKPQCLTISPVQFVTLQEVQSAFFLLGIAFLISFVVLLVELLNRFVKKIIKTKK